MEIPATAIGSSPTGENTEYRPPMFFSRLKQRNAFFFRLVPEIVGLLPGNHVGAGNGFRPVPFLHPFFKYAVRGQGFHSGAGFGYHAKGHIPVATRRIISIT